MGVAAVVEDSGFIDMREQLAPKQVKAYVEHQRERGLVEFNNGSILVKSRHPLDQCLRRGIIEEQHHESGKRIMTIRDCAFARTSGRIYNDVGEGDSGIDAMTLFINTERLMKRIGNFMRWGAPWDLVKLVCFCEPDMDGNYFREPDYAMLYGLGPNIQNAFEELDKAVAEARDAIKARIKKAEVNDDGLPPRP